MTTTSLRRGRTPGDLLFSIGLVFMAVTAVVYVVGSMQQNIRLPTWLQGRFDFTEVGIGVKTVNGAVYVVQVFAGR